MGQVGERAGSIAHLFPPSARVKDRPVFERADVVHADLVARSWEPAGARPLDGLHQALTGKVNDAALRHCGRRLELAAVCVEAAGDAHWLDVAQALETSRNTRIPWYLPTRLM